LKGARFGDALVTYARALRKRGGNCFSEFDSSGELRLGFGGRRRFSGGLDVTGHAFHSGDARVDRFLRRRGPCRTRTKDNANGKPIPDAHLNPLRSTDVLLLNRW